MHPYDLFFYDPVKHTYTVDKWLDDVNQRYGGVNGILIWPTYTNIGVDDRNAYDLIRLLPGGLDELRRVVDELHSRGVSVLWPLMIWDEGTRPEGVPQWEAMASLNKQTGGDGLNGDTMAEIPRELWEESVRQGMPAALQPELGGTFESLAWTTLGWGELGWFDLSEPAPIIDAFKWLQPQRQTNVCRRWDRDRNSAFQTAWFNGVGYESWENVWGVWNGFTPRDGAALRRLQPLQAYFSSLLKSAEWEPHVRTLQPKSVFASRFPADTTTRGGQGMCRTTLWTIVERAGIRWDAAALLEAEMSAHPGCVWFDAYHGTELSPARSANGRKLIL